jgi:eukaryotic-like serine/threonine-protein kinase
MSRSPQLDKSASSIVPFHRTPPIMPAEPTLPQSNEDRDQAKELSLLRTRPPADIEGYEIESFLGSGAYGEVWVASDMRTSRRVAIKFYTYRGGVDWSLLSREVEKLVFLSADRYVVQLLDVGWDADPPYYVMEFIEQGSLDQWLGEHGTMSVADAVDLFRDVAIGLLHAHGRGVLHCDLKPANVLLDQDRKPRLADFGQSRLTHEQAPSLGTLFYMAPEQADLKAVPDARWDVYALGAMLYCALTGAPPYRMEQHVTEIEEAADLPDRLARYRRIIRSSPAPQQHRKMAGMDRQLADIINKCLAVDPEERFSNVQAVLDALDARERHRTRRPLVVLGFAGPLILLLVMSLFGMRGYQRATQASEAALTSRAQEKNLFAAKAVAGKAAEEIQRYFRAVQRVADEPHFQQLLWQAQRPESELEQLLVLLRDPNRNNDPLEARDFLWAHPDRQPLQGFIDRLLDENQIENASSWFVTDALGTQIAAAFDDDTAASTIGQNYGWRTYFHGEPDDLVDRSEVAGKITIRYALPEPGRHIRRTHLSTPFQSKATNLWKVAVSAPIFHQGEFLGVIAVTVDIGVFMRFEDSSPGFFAVLVDGRREGRPGMILQHPLFDDIRATRPRLPESFTARRVALDQFVSGGSVHYQDPLGEDPLGADYRRRWIAAMVPVVLEVHDPSLESPELIDTGLKVLVQEDHVTALAPVHSLGQRLVREGLLALAMVILVILAMWGVVMRAMRESSAATQKRKSGVEPTPFHELSTLASPRRTPRPTAKNAVAAGRGSGAEEDDEHVEPERPT